MGRLFGTDGVRGVANTELTCALAFKIGQAGAYILASEVHRPKIIIGRDTRISCKMLEAALTAGICSIGGDVILTGVIPTPAMAYLVRQYSADAAVMISASHNSYEYNGIKWFSAKGYKLSDALEDKIEEFVKADGMPIDMPSGMNIGSSTKARNAAKEYAAFLSALSEKTLSGMPIALDCANGAASFIAPELFRSLGATVCETASTPNGCNINDMCGSTKPNSCRTSKPKCGRILASHLTDTPTGSSRWMNSALSSTAML
jgi:phosphoglucosamine mutase